MRQPQDWLDLIGYEIEPQPTAEQARRTAEVTTQRDNDRRKRGWSESEIKCGFAVWEHA